MEFTGERFVPGLCNEELESEHMNRYRFAAALVKGLRVLDIACGAGYGSMMLKTEAASVIGMDISEDAIEHCKKTYHADGLEYRVGSVADIPLEDASVDVIVSFETLEHVSEELQRKFMEEARRVLTKNGMLIISTPNKGVYDERGDNHFHVHELEPEAFEDLLQEHFKNVTVYGQMSEICNVIVTGSDTVGVVSDGPAIEACEYLLAICSDAKLPIVPRVALVRKDDPLRQLRKWASENNNRIEELSAWGKSLDEQITQKDVTINKLNQHIEELSAWGKSLDEQIVQKDATINNLNLHTEELSAWGKGLDEQIAQKDATINQLNLQAEELSAWGKNLDEQIAQKDATINKLNQQTEELSVWGKELEMKMKEKNENIKHLTEWGNRMNEQIAETTSLMKSLTERNEIIRQREEQYAAEMKHINDLIDLQAAEISYHKGHIEALEHVVDECNDKLNALQREKNVLQHQVNYLTERERQLTDRDRLLTEIENSRAYRLCRAMQKTSGVLLPIGSQRRSLVGKAARFIRHPIRMLTSKKATVQQTQTTVAANQEISYNQLPFESDDLEDFAPLTFPKWEKPLVSIVIPVYNQFGYTYACLESILKNTQDVTYEVIIANDCSTDLTSRMTEIISGITVVTNEVNLRFLKNCNHAAKHARGKFILFLNNDTRVLPGWLSSLVELINSDTSIGMVGSKLVFCNGRLQEAGGIVFSDGNCWNYGRNEDPDAPAFNYVKEVDYISGAAIMIRTSLWKKIGGFDEYFCPAYYEDTDLAFSVRKEGYKVVYQPKSVVIHYEGVSNGSDTSTGQKKYQVDNQIKFKKKWAKELEGQTDHEKLDLFLARDRSTQKRHLLVVDHYVPTFDKDAGSRNIYLYLKTFVKMGYQVHFIGDNYAHEEPYTSTVQGMGIEVLYGSEMMFNWSNWLMDNGRHIGAALLHRPHISIKYIDTVKEMIKGPVVYDVADLHRIRLMKEYSINHDPKSLAEAKRMGDMEDYCMKKADLVYSVSVDECTYLNGAMEGNKAYPCPIFVYEEYPQINAAKKRKNLLFVGGFGHAPNQDAVRWFLGEVLPIVRKALPDVVFNIVGSKTPEDLLAMGNDYIHFKGFVSDEELTKLYNRSRLVVIPLRYGAGVKGKTIEAMYNGCAIVSTSTGIEGIENIREIIKPHDDAQSFAEAVIKTYRSDEEVDKLGHQNQEYVRKYFGYERTAQQFIRDFGDPVRDNLKGE